MKIGNKRKIAINWRVNNKGFSLMEMIIAIFVFSLIITAVIGTFVSVINVKKKATAVQRNTENARFAMEQMAKTLRTSSILDTSSATDLIVFDYSQNACIEYNFSSNNLQSKIGIKDSLVGVTPIVCLFPGGYINMITGSLDNASFAVTQSTSAPPTIGKVTIALRVCSDSLCAGPDRINIQTTVSLRDYQEVNP